MKNVKAFNHFAMKNPKKCLKCSSLSRECTIKQNNSNRYFSVAAVIAFKTIIELSEIKKYFVRFDT